jgi:hypothetical protein
MYSKKYLKAAAACMAFSSLAPLNLRSNSDPTNDTTSLSAPLHYVGGTL